MNDKNRLAISNIAWPSEDNSRIAALMKSHGITALEVAPGQLFPSPLAASPNEIKAVRDFWAEYGIKIIAMQGLLFGRPDLVVFGDDAQKETFQDYMRAIIDLAAALGAGPLVFGAPAARRRGNIPLDDAMDYAAALFKPLAAYAHDRKCSISFEPNASDYGCDFVTTLKGAITLVQKVDHPGFGLQIDTGNFEMENDDPADLDTALSLCRHFHISAPFLSPPQDSNAVRQSLIATALRSSYTGYISIEMRRPEDGDPVDAVDQVLHLIKNEMGGMV